MTAGIAMTNYGMKEEYVQANIYRQSQRKRHPHLSPLPEGGRGRREAAGEG